MRWCVTWGYVSLCVVTACSGGAARTDNTLRLPLINDPIFNPVLAPDIGSVMVN